MKFLLFDDKGAHIGETRIVKIFLWFPKIIDWELRWLCHVEIKQLYSGFRGVHNHWCDYVGWDDLEFVD